MLIAIAAVPAAFWTASVFVAAFWSGVYGAVAREDGLLEMIQVLTLLACVVTAGVASRSLSRRGWIGWGVLYALGAAALFWLLGEEISWGQRIFGWDTPDWLGANVQDESNLHNLPGAMDWLAAAAFVVIPVFSIASLLLWMRGPSFVRRWRLYFWMPHPVLVVSGLCFWSYARLREFDKWYFGLDEVHNPVSRLQESAETILYGAMLVFIAMALRCAVREPREAGGAEQQVRGWSWLWGSPQPAAHIRKFPQSSG